MFDLNSGLDSELLVAWIY